MSLVILKIVIPILMVYDILQFRWAKGLSDAKKKVEEASGGDSEFDAEAFTISILLMVWGWSLLGLCLLSAICLVMQGGPYLILAAGLFLLPMLWKLIFRKAMKMDEASYFRTDAFVSFCFLAYVLFRVAV